MRIIHYQVLVLCWPFLVEQPEEYVILDRPVDPEQTVPQQQSQIAADVGDEAVAIVDAVVFSDLVLAPGDPEHEAKSVPPLLKPPNAIEQITRHVNLPFILDEIRSNVCNVSYVQI